MSISKTLPLFDGFTAQLASEKVHQLAENIRKGCGYHPQCFKGYFGKVSASGAKPITGTCALGAAYEAEIGKQETRTSELVMRAMLHFDWLYKFETKEYLLSLKGKLASYFGGTLYDSVVRMNDCYSLSREEIADHLDEFAEVLEENGK